MIIAINKADEAMNIYLFPRSYIYYITMVVKHLSRNLRPGTAEIPYAKNVLHSPPYSRHDKYAMLRRW
jgi:hypothetical protein